MVRVSAMAHGRIRGARALSMIVAAAVATAVLGFETTPAVALGYSSPFDNDQFRIARKSYGRRASKAGAPFARDAKRAEVNNPERPLFVVVSISDQRVSIYNHHGLVERSAISTGMAGHPTPKGMFTIIGRERYHRSNIYSGAPMPFMQRITWSGIAMHLGVVPGHPASHGCIRLPAAFAVRLWGLTRIGERVVISPQDVTPAEFSHPLLPAPKMQLLAEADKATPAVDAPQTSEAAAPPPQFNPRQYAEQLKAKAAAEAAAAAKTLKETSASIPAKQQEAARAMAELQAAEAAHASARAKADAAAKAHEAAAAIANSKRQESVLVAELERADHSAGEAAEAGRSAKGHAEAAAAEAAAATAKTNADAALADAANRLETAKAVSTAKAAEVADAVRRADDARAASEAAAKAEKDALLRMAPLSVLVSKKDRRIYVRQGLTPIFDAPASVRDPEAPLGSHLYIATAAADGGTSLKWSVVSVPPLASADRGGHRTKTASIDERAGASTKQYASASSPAEALERVEIAQEVRDRIAERLWTGGSLIISDQPLSGETGNVGTDLTVKIR